MSKARYPHPPALSPAVNHSHSLPPPAIASAIATPLTWHPLFQLRSLRRLELLGLVGQDRDGNVRAYRRASQRARLPPISTPVHISSVQIIEAENGVCQCLSRPFAPVVRISVVSNAPNCSLLLVVATCRHTRSHHKRGHV